MMVWPGILLGGLLLTGCPDSPSGGNSGTGTGTAKETPTKRSGPGYPAVLDEGLPNHPRTPEQTARAEEMLARYRINVDIGKKPILEAVAMVEEVAAKTPQEPTLRYLQLKLFGRMRNDEFLDEDLARARVRLGEAMLTSELASTPQLHAIIEMIVESYDYLGEAGKGDALLEKTLRALSEPVEAPSAATNDGPTVIHRPPASAAETPAGAPSRSDPSQSGPSAAAQTAAPRPAGGWPSDAEQAVAAANMRKRSWRWVRQFQLDRLARRDFAATDAILEEECRVAWQKCVAEPGVLPPVRDWVALCQTRVQIARSARHPEVVERVETELLSTARTLAEAHPDSAEHFALLMQMRGLEVGRVADKDPEGASELLALIRRAIEGSKFAQDPALVHFPKSLSGYDFLIRESRFRHDLIGKPAPPLDVSRWVHGEPLPAESLQGKVVLLEFWSPTRIASVAAFPRLNALHEEFHDKGLEIVGVARTSGAVWDPVRKRAENIPHKFTVDTEAELLKAVAEHHQHRFPTFLVPQATSFYDAYGVGVVPHSIVIDRQGKIRLTQRVPDEAGVRTIRGTIESLLAE